MPARGKKPKISLPKRYDPRPKRESLEERKIRQERIKKLKSQNRKEKLKEILKGDVSLRGLPEQIKDIYHGRKFRDGGEAIKPARQLRTIEPKKNQWKSITTITKGSEYFKKRKKIKDKEKYEEAYSTVSKPQKPRPEPTGPKIRNGLHRYWSPQLKKYVYRRPPKTKTKIYATGGIVDKGNGKVQTGGIKKVQLSGKHWNKDIG